MHINEFNNIYASSMKIKSEIIYEYIYSGFKKLLLLFFRISGGNTDN